MGTNYYLRTNCCAACGRSDELHIGKLSWGWEFSFQAYRQPPIRSREDWEAIIGESSVFDEYGTEIPSRDFWDDVDDSRGPSKKHQTDYVHANHPEVARDYFKDPAGWSFSETEFS